MNEQITLTLPAGVLRQAEELAVRAGKPVEQLLAQTIELSLRPLGTAGNDKTMSSWDDETVLAACDATMPAEEDRRFSELLHAQQAGTLKDGERGELQALMGFYQRQSLKKAQALAEAVRRGLRGPVEP